MGKLDNWIEQTLDAKPDKPDEEKLNSIMCLDYSSFNKMKLWDIERAIYILSSWLYYVSYQHGILHGRSKAMRSNLDSEIAFEAQKYKSGYFEERKELAKSNNADLKDRSIKIYEIEAQSNSLKEIKFSIKDKIDVLKMIYYRKRSNERPN